MKSKLLYFFLFPIISIAQPAADNDFKFQLNHIDICVDSVTYHALLTNKFISETFSYTKTPTDSTGSEFLVLGQEGYIHFLPEKGFYKNRLGACLLVHHSFRWKETDTLIDYLQSFTKDSLYNRPYRSPEIENDYINVYENLEDTSRLLKFIPILSNGSKKNYISWGYTAADLEKGISQKKYMQDYVGKETRDKLFKNIQSIQVTASADEQKRIPGLLKAYGYRKNGNEYSLQNNPEVSIIPLTNKRIISVHLKLSKPFVKKIIRLSDNAVLKIAGDNAWFGYSIF